MKKLFKVLAFTFSAIFGVATVSSVLLLKPASRNNASEKSDTVGFYQKVNNLSSLEDGDKVLVLNGGGMGISFFGGNPCFPNFDDTGLRFTKDEAYCGAENAKASEFTVTEDGNYYVFTSRFRVSDYTDTQYDVALAYNNRGNNNDWFTNVGSFSGGFGLYKTDNLNNDNCRWSLTNEFDQFNECNIKFTNVANDGLVEYFNLYRLMTSPRYEYHNNATGIDIRDYWAGDRINLKGLVVSIADNNIHDWIYDLSYNTDPQMFYFADGGDIVALNKRVYPFKIYGLTNVYNDVQINEPVANPGYEFDPFNVTSLNDYRGLYLLVNNQDSRYFNSRIDDLGYAANSVSYTLNNNSIPVTSSDMLLSAISIERAVIDDKSEYVAKNGDGKYLVNDYYTSTNYGDYTKFITFTDSITAANALTINNLGGGNGVQIGFTNITNGHFFSFSYFGDGKSFICTPYGENYSPAVLFKIGETNELNADLDSFKATFNSVVTPYSTVSAEDWNTCKAAFNALGAEAQGYLANLTYDHGIQASGSIFKVIDCYEYAVARYNYEDFMNRKDFTSFGIAVKGIISDIGEVTLEKEQLIIDAREAYGRLNDGQKSLVTNLSTLEKAEYKLQVLQIDTRSSLAYHYVKDNEGHFTFTNLYVRFGGIISKTLWDEIDTTYTITGYGEMFSTDTFMDVDKLKDFYDLVEQNYPSIEKHYYEVTSNPESMPALFNASNYQGVVDDYYVWNIRRSVDEEHYTTVYASVAFITTRDGGVFFFDEVRKSVKSLAQDLIDGPNYNAESLDGSLAYLADL